MFKFNSRTSATRAPATPSGPVEQQPAGSQVATFAGGCFWGVEAAFREIEGVVETSVGYTGGQTSDPTYEQVCGHTTGSSTPCPLRS
jgi:peptide-methionine (S)-S-oxide reductase